MELEVESSERVSAKSGCFSRVYQQRPHSVSRSKPGFPVVCCIERLSVPPSPFLRVRTPSNRLAVTNDFVVPMRCWSPGNPAVRAPVRPDLNDLVARSPAGRPAGPSSLGQRWIAASSTAMTPESGSSAAGIRPASQRARACCEGIRARVMPTGAKCSAWTTTLRPREQAGAVPRLRSR
jgi:hypothetical protein